MFETNRPRTTQKLGLSDNHRLKRPRDCLSPALVFLRDAGATRYLAPGGAAARSLSGRTSRLPRTPS